jgi:integrase
MGGSRSPRRVVRVRPRVGTMRLLRPSQSAGLRSGDERQSTTCRRSAPEPCHREKKRLSGQACSKLDADLLTAAEIERLMRQCSRRAPTGVRNRALIAVCWRCGLRIGEALALAVKDFEPDSGTLVVQRGKGGKRRFVGVDSGTVALVSRCSRRGGSDAFLAAPRSFARWRANRSSSRTSGTCFPGSRGRPASSAACTHTDSGTLSRWTWSDQVRRFTSCATRSDTRASRRRRCT